MLFKECPVVVFIYFLNKNKLFFYKLLTQSKVDHFFENIDEYKSKYDKVISVLLDYIY